MRGWGNIRPVVRKLIIFFLISTILQFSQGGEPVFEKILSIKIQVEMDDNHGEFMDLKSGYYPYTKGEFSGVAEGVLLPQGGARNLYSDSYLEGKRLIEDEIIMVLLTDSGEKIYCEALGLILRDTDTDSNDFMHTSWRFRTASPNLAWLNTTVGIAKTRFFNEGSEYRAEHNIYRIVP